MTDTKIPAPVPHFDLKVGNETKKILMSFGLINKLAEKLTEMESGLKASEQVLAPAKTREIICSYIFTLDEKGRPHPETYDEFEHTKDIAVDDIQKLFGWVNDHLTDFFITSQEQTAAAMKKQEARMATLNQNVNKFSETVTGQKNS